MSHPTRFAGLRFIMAGRRNTGPCPYAIRHAKVLLVPSWRKGMMFKKWFRRPSSAYALYWRMHQAEHAAAFPGARCKP